jgi:retinol dehydrogenase-12
VTTPIGRLPEASANSMGGKVCLVTGATAGLGFVTARELAARGATVIVVGRDPGRCADACQRIVSATQNERVNWIRADLSSQRDVRQLAKDVQQRHDRLDVLVNNAGAMFLRRQTSTDGIEMTFALNHLAYFLLTSLLLDALEASIPSRIVNVSSVAHERATGDPTDLHSRRYRGYDVYARSKLANLLYTYELARRLGDTGVTVNAVNPGLVRTNFGANNGLIGRLGAWLVHLRYREHSIGTEEGARTIVYLATSPAVAGVSGKYFEGEQRVPSSPLSHDAVLASRLWQLSDTLTKDSSDSS